jgi:hypothetical protein
MDECRSPAFGGGPKSLRKNPILEEHGFSR